MHRVTIRLQQAESNQHLQNPLHPLPFGPHISATLTRTLGGGRGGGSVRMLAGYGGYQFAVFLILAEETCTITAPSLRGRSVPFSNAIRR